MKWFAGDVVGFVLGFGMSYLSPPREDLIYPQSRQDNIAGAILFVNLGSLLYDTIGPAAGKVVFFDAKGREVEKLSCQKTDSVDFLCKFLQVSIPPVILIPWFTPSSEFWSEATGLKITSKAMSATVVASISCLVTNVIGNSLYSPQYKFYPQDHELYLSTAIDEGEMYTLVGFEI